MADFNIKLDSLNSKKSSLESMVSKISQIKDTFDGSSLKSSKSGYSTVANRIKTNMNRLTRGYNNSKSWFNSYLSELESLESSLASFSCSGLTKPSEFKGEFEDIFGKITMPCLKTGAERTTIDLGNLEVKSYSWQTYTFTASNGVKIEYYMYVPDFGADVGKLPVMVYMHGGSAHGTSKGGWTSGGLTKLINDGKIKPPGIVICPYIRNFEGDNIAAGVNELVDHIVQTQNGDPSRLSVSGHSYGAITTYRIVEQFPGKYAAAVPISGWNKVNSGVTGTKFWAFHGSKDNRGGGSHTTYPGALETMKIIQQYGGTALMHTFEGAGHGNVQTYTYQQPYMSPDGEEEYVVDWAMRQKSGYTGNEKLATRKT